MKAKVLKAFFILIGCALSLFFIYSLVLTFKTQPRELPNQAEQLEWLVNDISDEECKKISEAMGNSNHTETRNNISLDYICRMKAMKAKDLQLYEQTLQELRKHSINEKR